MSEIRFDNTSVGYQGKELMKDVSFEAQKGEILALVGPNGAGKSTVLKTAAGLIPPISGKVFIQDKELTAFRRSDLAKIMSVMLTEKVNTEYDTCYDMVRVGRFQYTDMFGRLTPGDKRAIDDAMELIGVTELRDRAFSKLSDGQKQRVLLARAIVSEPQILILDEPTSFLDMGYKTEFFDVLRNFVKEKNASVLISMHEIELVKKVADRCLCITGHNTVDRIGPPEGILSAEYLEQLFGMSAGKYREYYE
jgi:iron complex transport system ATP-binding protein